MSTPSYSAPPPLPPPPPTDLKQVDEELAKLGYKEGQTAAPASILPPAGPAAGTLPFGQPRPTAARTPFADAVEKNNAGQRNFFKNPNQARIDQLLEYRKKFLDAEDKARIGAPRSRAANILTGPQGDLSPANLASRTLLS